MCCFMTRLRSFWRLGLDLSLYGIALVVVFSVGAQARQPVDLDDFFRAVTDGRAAMVRTFLSLHPEWANAELFSGIRPLYRASVLGREGVVDELLAKGASVQATTDRGTGALSAAVQHGYQNIALKLIQAGAPLNEADNRGQTPIFFAARFNRVELLGQLVAQGALVNALDRLGRTPLHYAAATGRLEETLLLLNNGAEIDPVDDQGYSPLGLCLSFTRNDFVKVAQLLRERGAKDIRPPSAWKRQAQQAKAKS